MHPDRSTVFRLVCFFQDSSGFATVLSQMCLDRKRIINLRRATKSGSESNNRKAEVRIHELVDCLILPQQPLSKLCRSDGQTATGKSARDAAVQAQSVCEKKCIQLLLNHQFIFTWFLIQPFPREHNKKSVIISLNNKLFTQCLLNAKHYMKHWEYSNKQIHKVHALDNIKVQFNMQ